ncbi:unnamed protein product [Acanthoscelides obtectus]|uniref:Uncharacterized protein n=1 Tax=Acanthoscelides obtectus TaxID=200917 RepID=A0A9P0LDG8_ACAOB|nr:unnamed protein product [Acanthoscelides obtectus]CAK1662476.1 hypothetical protein AOBTE_LOCUS23160 [Acanthoscelides obtectus]
MYDSFKFGHHMTQDNNKLSFMNTKLGKSDIETLILPIEVVKLENIKSEMYADETCVSMDPEQMKEDLDLETDTKLVISAMLHTKLDVESHGKSCTDVSLGR